VKIDFGQTATDYGKHRAGFPDSFFERIESAGVLSPGQRVVDLGSGTGTLAQGFARRGCPVVGIEPAAPMRSEAERLCAEANLAVEYRDARAEDTGLPSDSADLVVAGQCWHWFDRAAAATEAARLLGAAGRLVVAHFDWIPIRGNVADVTERLIEAHNPGWKFGGGNGMYPRWLSELARWGYRDLETWSYDLSVPYTPESWRGRIRASAGVGASLPPDQVEAFDRELAATLAERFPGDTIGVHHRVFTLVARPPGARAAI
jgi:SAM-dependent methyltransferase